MSKIVIVSLLAALIVGGGSLYLLLGGNTSPEDTLVAPVAPSPAPSPEEEITSGFSTLSGLASLGRALECTLRYEPANDPANTVTGTYFTNNGMVRGDFIVPGLPEGSVSSLIFTPDTVYSWTIIAGQGYGVTIDQTTWQSLANNPDTAGTQTPIPATTPLEYSCKPWVVVDGSIFIPPSDILFKEYETAISTGMEYGTVYEEPTSTDIGAQCALCEQVAPGEGRDQCRYNFKCLTE